MIIMLHKILMLQVGPKCVHYWSFLCRYILLGSKLIRDFCYISYICSNIAVYLMTTLGKLSMPQCLLFSSSYVPSDLVVT